MTDQEKIYFEQLREDRLDSKRILDKSSMSGIKRSVVEKYSDTAHFVYELLQNANDVGAKSVTFKLYSDKLVFTHNGRAEFSISDPNNEEKDEINGKLGDLNAITSIGQSNKRGDESKIGKFGFGFKSVFQYTDTPMIYAQNICFKLEYFYVPTLIEKDFPGRKKNETVFVFPFNRVAISPLTAYDEIKGKLLNLIYPNLFLSSIEEISFEINGNEKTEGIYNSKIINKKKYKDNTIGEKIVYASMGNSDEIKEDTIWKFSRKTEDGLEYSVCFFFDDKGKLIEKPMRAFCFFPTKVTTNLNFVIHAPFLLTESREGIQASSVHNKNMVQKLAKLSADSFVYLKDIGIEEKVRIIDDNIIDFVPRNVVPSFSDEISFKPFFDEIKSMLKAEEILPCKNGEYVMAENAYIAKNHITALISNEQLVQLTGNKEAKWVFVTRSADDTYIKSIVGERKCLLDADILNGKRYLEPHSLVFYTKCIGMTEEFIKQQDKTWLFRLYKWIIKDDERQSIAEKSPIFLDTKEKPIALYSEWRELQLFEPSDFEDEYNTINHEIWENDEAQMLLRKLGIKKPSLKEQVYIKIIPMYSNRTANPNDVDKHIKLFFEYYKSVYANYVCRRKLINDIKTLSLFSSLSTNKTKHRASELYFNCQNLIDYWGENRKDKLLDYQKYVNFLGRENEEIINQFFVELGVKQTIKLEMRTYMAGKDRLSDNIESWIDYFYDDEEISRSRGKQSFVEPEIDGFYDQIASIKDLERSIRFWNALTSFDINWRQAQYLTFNYSRKHKKEKMEVVSLIVEQMRDNYVWLYNKNCELERRLTVQSMHPDYDTESENARILLELLEIPNEDEEEKKIVAQMSCEQKEQYELGNLAKQLNLTSDDLRKFSEQKQREVNIKELDVAESEDDRINSKNSNRSGSHSQHTTHSHNNANQAGKSIDDLTPHERKVDIVPWYMSDEDEFADEGYSDEVDEYVKPCDFDRKIAREEKKSNAIRSALDSQKVLQSKAKYARKYSYEWFCSLLGLEFYAKGQNEDNEKQISLSFSKVELEPDTTRTLLLKFPNRNIPAYIEELSDINMDLVLSNNEKIVLTIEAMSVVSYELHAKMRAEDKLKKIDFSSVVKATFTVNSPNFLLKELRCGYDELGYEEDFDMKANLCDNIDFVFGPPGTGKTTYLANEVLIKHMNGNDGKHVLVMAPTNKAADVIANRIIEEMTDDSYKNWLIRFGTTSDENLEQLGVAKERTVDLNEYDKCVVITTIARFPYDYFMKGITKHKLCDHQWDYIVIDEASMVPLVNLIYPLYKKKPKKFIIAGDPLQIEPIVEVAEWQNENIFTMVGLNSFSDPHTEPHDYNVTLLTTQYRSVPAIGKLFSDFAYGGLLNHARSKNDQRDLNIQNKFKYGTMNMIEFPVKKYESVYKSKRLKTSPYHVYSAIFAHEFAIYLSKLIAAANPTENFSIGIISPYKTQATLIDKLITPIKLPNNVTIQTGTIHSFQGDECDIVICVFNTPPTVSDSRMVYLNKQNIINVAISRARDYLFVLVPDGETEGMDGLKMLRKVVGKMRECDSFVQMSSFELEKLMFDKENYIEENAFSTSHQSVNVYGLPEKRYEIRSDDCTAIDIQVHNNVINN